MYPYPQGAWAVVQNKPVSPDDGPARDAPHGLWADRFGLIFGVCVIVVTLVAVLLGILAPSFSAASTSALVPSGWTQAFDGQPTDDGTWITHSDGCALAPASHILEGGDNGVVCAFKASTQRDLTSQGFTLEALLAPAAAVPGDLKPLIEVGTASDGAVAAIDQNGEYILCRTSSSESAPCLSNFTVAWHGTGSVANSLALRYLPDAGGGGSLTLFANGQPIDSVALDLAAGEPIGIGAAPSSEALYARVTIFSATA
jgi:hypothetical protein